jgi:hypothetical protein
MTYSYTQISQYLRCPRSYRYRYLDGWREKDTRAAMVFGRCFETALAAYFSKEDCTAVLVKEWEAYREAPLEYLKATPGTKPFTRASTCCICSPRMIGFGSDVLKRIFS